MKVVELRAERAKICENYFSWTNPYVVKKDTGMFGGFVTEDLPEEILRENYEIDQKMLVRLDKINNALNESDANTYIDVHGKHLSIATARRYLAELRSINEEDNIWEECPYNECPYTEETSSNRQEMVYSKCCVDISSTVKKDPMHLLEKQKEIKDKRKSWKYDLYVQVQISDATTEVSFIE